MADRKITLYIDLDDEVWATDKDANGSAYAVRQVVDSTVHEEIIKYGKVRYRGLERDDDTVFTDPADLAAQAFAWITFTEDGVVHLYADASVITRRLAAARFLMGHRIDDFGLVGLP